MGADPNSTDANSADAAVMARLAAGDQRALADLYDRYASLLLGLGVKLLRDKAEAEDVLHDVFVEVWKRARDFDVERGSVRAWLALRMRSRCLDKLKSPRLARRTSFDDSEAARREATPQNPLLKLERERVRAALNTLSDDHRVVVELAYFHGLSTNEIATRVGVAQGTVKSRLFAARERLHQALHSEDGLSALGGTP